jgi:DNA-binding MarR family transcriptional regulator
MPTPTNTERRTPEVTEVASRLRLVLARLGRRLRQESNEGLSPSMLSALSTIDRAPAITLGELAAAERVKPSSVTVLAGRLEEAGLVTREPDPGDRRVWRIRLTEQGRRLLDRHRSGKTAYLVRRLRKLPPKDLEALVKATVIMERLFEDPR